MSEDEVLTIDEGILSLLASNKRREATEAIVQTIEENEIIKTTISDENPEMWLYKEGIYVPEAKTKIKQWCRALLGEAHTTQIINEVIGKIEVDTYIDKEKFFNEQNKNPYILPIKNGLLNLKTQALQDYTHEIAFFNKINASYKKEADCPAIKQFLKDITSNEEDINIIQELIGFCLVREYKYEKAFMMYGSHGRNGKSKLLDLLKRFLGSENISSISLESIEKDDNFFMKNMHNKLANVSSDISNSALNNTGNFKALTGRDLITANVKNKEMITFVNYAKMIFACNEMPPVYTLSDSFWLRWLIIEFPYQFLQQKDINVIPKNERKNIKLQDQSIIDKISTEEELNGLLVFALEGLKRLEENNDFSSNKSAKHIKHDWLRKSNSVAAFIEDHIEEDYYSYIIKKDFVKAYHNYCKKYRLKPVSEKVIKITLKDEMGISESRPVFNNVQVHSWDGIKLLNSQDSQDSHPFSHSIENRNSLGTSNTMTKLTKLTKKAVSLYTKQENDKKQEDMKQKSYFEKTLSLENKLLNNVLKLIKSKTLISYGELQKFHPAMTDEFIEKAKEEGYLYEPKSGFLAVIE